MANESILKRTKNAFRAIGTVNELALERSDCEIQLQDADGNPTKKVSGERIMGRFTLRVKEGIYPFKVYFQSLNARPDKDGKHDSKQWKMAESMLKWNPEINSDGSPATVVNVDGDIAINDYVGQDGEVRSSLQYNVRKASIKVSEGDNKGFSWNGVAFIDSITEEVVAEEETGRLIVNLYGANNKGECFPIKAFVDEDNAEAFNDCFEAGQTIPLDIDVTSRHVGGKKNAGKKAFGRAASVETSGGYDIIEMMIVGADNAIEESEDEDENGNPIDNGYISPAVMKKAKKARAQKLEELKNNPPEKKGSIKEQKKQMAKTKTVEAPDLDDDDLF